MVSDLPPVVNILVYHQLGTILPTPISGHLKDLILADLQVKVVCVMFILPMLLNICVHIKLTKKTGFLFFV